MLPLKVEHDKAIGYRGGFLISQAQGTWRGAKHDDKVMSVR